MTDWDPSFFRRSVLFWPVARAAERLERFSEWPTPSELNALFDGAPSVRFELAAPRPRRARANAVPERDAYDARIAFEGVVPTRAQSWHDLLNALVWASFPSAKRALHARQHRMIAERAGEGARVPGARTKEQDAVAMLDEGGVALLCVPEARDELARSIAEKGGGTAVPEIVERGLARAAIFGHAIYEGLVCGGPERVHASAYLIEVGSLEGDVCARADASLAELLARESPILRTDFGTLAVDERLARATLLQQG